MWLTKIMRAVARAMRRAAVAMTKTMVWVGDRLVSMLVPAPMPMLDDGEDLEPEAVDEIERGSEMMPLRNLAYARLVGRVPTANELDAVNQLEAEWISTMSQPMLRQVLMSTDSRIRDHISGRHTIKGLLRCDRVAIDEYRISVLKERAREEQAKRSMPLRCA